MPIDRYISQESRQPLTRRDARVSASEGRCNPDRGARREARTFAADTLELGGATARPRRREATLPIASPQEPRIAPQTIGYTTRFAHPVGELAAQLGTTPEALAAANGWDGGNATIAAGTRIALPDTSETRAAVSAFGQSPATPAPAALDAPPVQVAPAALAVPPAGTPPADPNQYFMTQSRNLTWNPNGPDFSSDCGPASLAMALRAASLPPPGGVLPADASQNEAFIAATRQAMKPGSGSSDPTNVDDVVQGARAAGANAELVSGMADVEQALRNGKQVVAAGNPIAYNARFPSMYPYDGGHFILVTGVSGEGADKRFAINDPLSGTGSVEVTAQELEAYMGYQGWNSGVAVWGNAASPATPTPSPAAAGAALEKPPVVQMPSPNQNARPTGAPPDTIVLHHTGNGVTDGGSAQDIGRFFQDPASQVSSHYTVGKDGTIVQSVPDDRRAWHAGFSDFAGREDVNNFSLGIEIVNSGSGSDPFPDAQYEAVASLVAWMMQTYDIPMERITGHRDVSHEGKVDPADNFDWAQVEALVTAKLANS